MPEPSNLQLTEISEKKGDHAHGINLKTNTPPAANQLVVTAMVTIVSEVDVRRGKRVGQQDETVAKAMIVITREILAIPAIEEEEKNKRTMNDIHLDTGGVTNTKALTTMQLAVAKSILLETRGRVDVHRDAVDTNTLLSQINDLRLMIFLLEQHAVKMQESKSICNHSAMIHF